MSFALSNAVNPPCVFLVHRSQLRGRLDAEYNRALLSARINSKFPVRKLREIATSRSGGTPTKSRLDYWQGDILWASPKDFGPFFLTGTEDHISKAAVAESSTAVVPPGTLLIVFRSGVLQHSLPITVTTRETAINQDLKALMFSGEASAEYVGAYFVIFGRRLLPLITKSGATVQSINTEQFEEIGIPIPPRDLQNKIVEKLVDGYSSHRDRESKARELLASIEEVLLNELGALRKPEPPNTIESRIFRAEFSKVTGRRWDPNFSKHMARFLSEIGSSIHPVRKLKNFLATVQYGISDRATEDIVGVPMLRMLNLQDGEWSLSDLKYIAMIDTEKQRYLLNHGDILFNRTNSKELVGKCNVFNLEGEYVFASYLMRVSLKQGVELLPDYVVAYMASSLGRVQIDAVSRQIAGMTNINAEEVRELLIPTPPRSVQERICQRVAAIREQARQLRRQANIELEKTKQEIEVLILGEDAGV